MARTGRFGRLPRSAPNLASVIVAMVREVNAQEDANMLQAWEEGGLYKGKKVTDDMLLTHFKGRRDGMSKTDPLWDKWNTMVQNYEFAIEESKMSLRYAEKKVNDGQMANFYRAWAKKLPTDSEAYRNLMRSAAQFADAAAARAGGGGGGGRRSGGRRSGGGGGGRGGRSGSNKEAYAAAVQGAYEHYERKWDDAQYIMLEAAYRAGILQKTDESTPDDLMDLRGGDEADHQRFLDLFEAIQTDPYYADIKEVLAANGLGGLTYGQFVAAGDNKQAGFDARIQIAQQFGSEKDVKSLMEEKSEFITQRAIINDIDEFAWYQTVRRDVDAAIAAGGLSPFEVRDLLRSYAGGLDKLRASASSEQTRGFLNNELRALRGENVVGPTAYEGTEGGIRTKEGGDSLRYAGLLRVAEEQTRMIESGQAFMTSGVDFATGKVMYGAITRDDARLRDPTAGQVVFNIAGAGMNQTIPTFVSYRPILVQGTVGRDPRTGAPLAQVAAAQGSEVMGLTYTLNGIDYYGVFTGGEGSQMTWYSRNPFGDAKMQDTAEGLVLTAQITDDMLLADASGNQFFDPLRVLDVRARDRSLTDTARFDSALEAVYDTDPVARMALLRASDAELAAVAEASGNPNQSWVEHRELRNSIVDRHNVRVGQRGIFGQVQAQRGPDADVGGLNREPGELAQRTEMSAAEKRRALSMLESGREWEAQYRLTNPFAKAKIERRGAGPGGDGYGYTGPLSSDRRAVLSNLGTDPVLPEIKVPHLNVQPLDVLGAQPTRVAPTPRAVPIPVEPVTTPAPRPTPMASPPAYNPPITPTSPTLIDAEEEDELSATPTIRTPTITFRPPTTATPR